MIWKCSIAECGTRGAPAASSPAIWRPAPGATETAETATSPRRCCGGRGNDGYTLVELIAVMVITSILAAVALPRLASKTTFTTRADFEELSSSLRFARQQAVALRRKVCIAIDAGGYVVTRAPDFSAAQCSVALTDPATGQSFSRSVDGAVAIAARGATTGLPANIHFDALGRPNAAAGLQVSGEGIYCLNVEAETGYVRTVACS